MILHSTIVFLGFLGLVLCNDVIVFWGFLRHVRVYIRFVDRYHKVPVVDKEWYITWFDQCDGFSIPFQIVCKVLCRLLYRLSGVSEMLAC